MSILPLALAFNLGAAFAQIGFMLVLFVMAVLFSSLKVLREYERAVVFRLGRYTGVRGPGLVILIPGLERMVRVSTRIVTLDIPPQDVITKDNVSIQINAVVYFRVMDSSKAMLQVENYYEAISQLAQTTLRSVLGQHELDEMLTERDKPNQDIQKILDEASEPWGVKVANVEIKHVDLNDSMIRAMARQAEAERSRRAKVIHATGEQEAAEKLSQAAKQLSSQPQALQLRYMQTLIDVAGDKNSTIVFPLPMDLITPFMEKARSQADAAKNDSEAG